MDPKESRHPNRCGLSALLLFGLLLFLVYSNSLDATWHLDDFLNIISNPRVHADASQPDSILKPFGSFFDNGRLKRPLAFFTFAINWYWDQDNPRGYHLVNILIHLLAAFFLFRTIQVLFETPRLRGTWERSRIQFVSLLAAVLWAINPIQVNSVTYIVQRMASLCGMFYILSIYFYVNARLSGILTKKSILLYAACGLSFLAALLTKENAALLPGALVLIDATFFQKLDRKKVRWTILGIAFAMGIAVLIGGVFLFYKGNLLAFLSSERRFFTPIERLLTQPRILLFYLTLIFYPTPNRLSLVHDIEISTSFYHPWTTLPSIIVVFALIGFAVYKLRKWPILSFAILFFFLNHVIESSIIPLELNFEHRNYLPAMFLFWPVAVGLERLLTQYRERNPIVFRALLVFIPLLIVGLGTGTYIRNAVWSSGKLLWEDALRKAPQSARSYIHLAWSHYQRRGEEKMALLLYHKALKMKHNSKDQHAKIYNNIAYIHFKNGDCGRAIEYWQKSHEMVKSYYMPRYLLALALTRCGRFEEALSHLDHLIEQRPDYSKPLNLKAVIRLIQNQPQEALVLFRRCLKLEPANAHYYLNVGAGFHLLGDYQRAELFLFQALRDTRRERIALLWNAKNYLAMGKPSTADSLLDELVAKLPIDELNLWLKMGFKARVYKSEIIFPAADATLGNLLAAKYRQRLPALEQWSEPQPAGNKLAGGLRHTP